MHAYEPQGLSRAAAMMRNWIRGVAVALACLSLTVPLNLAAFLWLSPAPVHAGQAGERQEHFRELGRDLQRAFAALRAGLAELPRHEFHIASRAEQIGSDPADLLTFVRDRTGWLAYQGQLRGGQGVLMDRMGSHLDRALLLAHLAEAAGHNVKLARAELAEPQLEALLALPSTPPPAMPASAAEGEAEAFDRAVAEVAQRTGVEPARLRQELAEGEARAQRMTENTVAGGFEQSASLREALGWLNGDEVEADEAPQTIDDLDPATRSALADHWWVRIETEDGWLDLDPVLAEHRPGDSLIEAAETLDLSDVPEGDQHRLRIEIAAERLEEGELEEGIALAHTVAASELTGQAIIINLHPMNWPGDEAMFSGDEDADSERMRELALKQDEWMPVLDVAGDKLEQYTIRADGTINEEPGATATGRAFGQALEGLRRARDQGPQTHLTAVTLRFTVHAPGREPERFERPMVDLVGPSKRKADEPIELELTEAKQLQRSVGLLGSTRLVAQSCWLPDTYAIGRTLFGMLENRQAMLGAVHAASQDDVAGVASAMRAIRPQPRELLTLAHQRHAISPYKGGIAIERLNLFSYVDMPGWGEDGPISRQGFDIIQNAIVPLPGNETSSRQVRLTQGVLETNLEAALLDTDSPVTNAGRDFERALARGETWRVIDDAAALGELAEHLDADTRVHMERAIEKGQVIVLGEQPESSQALTWWRVDGETGTTLGMGPDARGAAVAEHLTLQNIALAWTLGGLLACTPGTVGLADPICCMIVWGVGEAGGLGLIAYLNIAGALAAAVGLAAGFTWAMLTGDVC